MKLKLKTFFSEHPVFTTEELSLFLSENSAGNRWTRKSLLSYHESKGHLLRVRRGLYAVVPEGRQGESSVDPYLVAAKLTDDAVLGYHTALSFYGKAYSVQSSFQFLTVQAARAFTFQSASFHPVLFPRALVASGKENYGVKATERNGVAVSVTSLERTLVDVLDRPDLGGGWEEVWRSLESVEFFDLDEVVKYAILLKNATTAAKVGFFLEQHREKLMVEESSLKRLRAKRPQVPHYAGKRGKPGKLVPGWNLIVPNEVADRSWEETP
jgi:predicted transcriptional regulator of viral defense system